MSDEQLLTKTISVNGLDTVIRDSHGELSISDDELAMQPGETNTNEAVVFVHGNPGSGGDWSLIMPEVAKFARTVAPDMPGFGQSAKPENFNYTIEGYAAHLDAMLKALSIERAHLVLHDFGGPWGLAWAAMNPQKVASLTLVNVGVLKGYSWHYLAKIWRTPLVGEFMMATTTRFGLSMLLKHGNPRGLPKEYLDEMYGNFDSGTKRAVLKLYRATSALGGAADMLHGALRPLDLDTLVVWGKRDPYISYEYAEKQKETFPPAAVHYLDDSGHWPFIDNPQGFADIVLPHLKRVAG